MVATAQQVATLRRYVNEPTTATYDDVALADTIERYPVAYRDPTTGMRYEPGEQGWQPSYDLNAAAAEVWTEKAGLVAYQFNYSADGSRMDAGTVQQNYERMAQHYASKARPRSVKITT